MHTVPHRDCRIEPTCRKTRKPRGTYEHKRDSVPGVTGGIVADILSPRRFLPTSESVRGDCLPNPRDELPTYFLMTTWMTRGIDDLP
jgi:hypothetical protein